MSSVACCVCRGCNAPGGRNSLYGSLVKQGLLGQRFDRLHIRPSPAVIDAVTEPRYPAPFVYKSSQDYMCISQGAKPSRTMKILNIHCTRILYESRAVNITAQQGLIDMNKGGSYQSTRTKVSLSINHACVSKPQRSTTA